MVFPISLKVTKGRLTVASSVSFAVYGSNGTLCQVALTPDNRQDFFVAGADAGASGKGVVSAVVPEGMTEFTVVYYGLEGAEREKPLAAWK